ncbi:hypothetical protein T484DRAFT_1881610 [Baffinella frigidus]|nr:hypothetical protein T484DRAFT_1881610 [Cryptophyta sp. CCMP2293]
MPRFNRRASQHNAMDHRVTSASHHTSEQEALFPSPLASRHLPRLRRATKSAQPPTTTPTTKDIGRCASNAETHFQCLLSSPEALFGPTLSAPTPTLRFPVEFYDIGQCLAHPDGEEGGRCKCIKTHVMAHSQAFAWNELGSRFKLVERTASAPLERTKIPRRHSIATPLDACSTEGPASSGPSRRVSMSTPTAADTSTPKTLASPGTTQKGKRRSRSKSAETLKLRLQSLNYAHPAVHAGPRRGRAPGSPEHLSPVKIGASPLPSICVKG